MPQTRSKIATGAHLAKHRTAAYSSSKPGQVSYDGTSYISNTPPHRPTNRHAEGYKLDLRHWYDYVMDEISRRTVYDTSRILGEGGQGRAALMRRRAGEGIGSLVVVKIFANEYNAAAEVQTLRNDVGEHKNLVQMVDAWECNNPIPGCSALLLEYCDRGSLFDYKKFLSDRREAVLEGFIWYTTHSLSQALAYLHCGYQTEHYDADEPFSRQFSIVHRDIKPENILLKTDPNAPFSISIKLADFGLTYKHDLGKSGQHSSYKGGTYDWQPMESIRPPHVTGPEQDMWSVGAIIHYLALGEPPVNASKADKGLLRKSSQWYKSIPRRVTRISGRPELRRGLGNHTNYIGDGHKPWSIKYSVKLNRWMNRLLQKDPKMRATAVELVEGMPDDFND